MFSDRNCISEVLFHKIKDDITVFSPGRFETQGKDSGSRRHADNQKDYSRHHRAHRLNDSMNSGKRHNQLLQKDNEKNERRNDAMDWRHRRSRDDNDVAGRISNDKISRKEKDMMQSYTKGRVEEKPDSFSKHESPKSKAFGLWKIISDAEVS